MYDPFLVLGLDHDADERAIKRAYAIRLRGTRPETDPEGFQALNEAYRFALELARERDTAEADQDAAPAPIDEGAQWAEALVTPMAHLARPIERVPSSDSSPPPAALVGMQGDAISPRQASEVPSARDETEPLAAFDFVAFFDALCERAADGDADALQDWLRRQPALWSLSTKALAGHATALALYEQAPPMPDRCLDVVLAFFDMDHVLAGHDPLRLGQFKQRLHLEWLLQHDRRELTAHLRAAQLPIQLDVRRVFDLLSGPFRWHEVLFQALPPNRPTGVATFLRHLQAARVERLPDHFNRRRIAFWMQAGDREALSAPRIAVGLARCLAILLLASAADGVLAAAGFTLVVPLTPVAFVAAGLWVLYVALTVVARWQNLPQEALSVRLDFWSRLLFIPSVCLIAGSFRHLPPADGVALSKPMLAISVALAALALILSIFRYRRRAGSSPIRWSEGFGGVRLLLLMFALKSIAVLGQFFIYYAEAGSALAGTVWLADLWKQRRRLLP